MSIHIGVNLDRKPSQRTGSTSNESSLRQEDTGIEVGLSPSDNYAIYPLLTKDIALVITSVGPAESLLKAFHREIG